MPTRMFSVSFLNQCVRGSQVHQASRFRLAKCLNPIRSPNPLQTTASQAKRLDPAGLCKISLDSYLACSSSAHHYKKQHNRPAEPALATESRQAHGLAVSVQLNRVRWHQNGLGLAYHSLSSRYNTEKSRVLPDSGLDSDRFATNH